MKSKQSEINRQKKLLERRTLSENKPQLPKGQDHTFRELLTKKKKSEIEIIKQNVDWILE